MLDLINANRDLLLGEAVMEATQGAPVRLSSVRSGISVWLPEQYRTMFEKRGVVMSVHRLGDDTLRCKLEPTPRSFRGKRVHPGKPLSRAGHQGFYLQLDHSRVPGLKGMWFNAVSAHKLAATKTHLTFWVKPLREPLPMERTPPVSFNPPPACPAEPVADTDLGHAVRLINDAKRRLGNSMEITVKEEGTLKVVIIEEFE